MSSVSGNLFDLASDIYVVYSPDSSDVRKFEFGLLALVQKRMNGLMWSSV